MYIFKYSSENNLEHSSFHKCYVSKLIEVDIT